MYVDIIVFPATAIVAALCLHNSRQHRQHRLRETTAAQEYLQELDVGKTIVSGRRSETVGATRHDTRAHLVGVGATRWRTSRSRDGVDDNSTTSSDVEGTLSFASRHRTERPLAMSTRINNASVDENQLRL